MKDKSWKISLERYFVKKCLEVTVFMVFCRCLGTSPAATYIFLLWQTIPEIIHGKNPEMFHEMLLCPSCKQITRKERDTWLSCCCGWATRKLKATISNHFPASCTCGRNLEMEWNDMPAIASCAAGHAPRHAKHHVLDHAPHKVPHNVPHHAPRHVL